MIPFLLALQAAGMVTDYLGKQSAIDAANEGYQRQQRLIERAIQLSRLQTADESLQAMKGLRQNLGTQAATLAARGTRGSAGIIGMTESIGNFSTDERMRRINQASKEIELRAGLDTAKLKNQAFKNEQWGAFAKNVLNKFPTNPEAYESFKSFGESFGLNKVMG